jgi:uncharacterized membrane protein YeaQ/YmgE (transglycosylase-associated protein family)
MKEIVFFVVDLLRQVVLSGLLAYIMLIVTWAGVSRYAWENREKKPSIVAGWFLGLLVSILLIFVVVSTSKNLQPSGQTMLNNTQIVELSSLIVPIIIGLITGFLALAILQFKKTEALLGIIVAVFNGGSLSMLFLMSISDALVRGGIGALAISFIIGAVFYLTVFSEREKTNKEVNSQTTSEKWG